MYLVSGSLTIYYSLNGYDGNYMMFTDVLADLRPIKDIPILLSSDNNDCYAVAIMPADDATYDVESILVSDRTIIPISNNEKIIIPLLSNVIINGKQIEVLTAVRLKPNKLATLSANDPKAVILVIEKHV